MTLIRTACFSVLRVVDSKAPRRSIHARVRRLVTLSLAIGLMLAASSARADHIPGAVYTGTHSGGGTVEFHVSADGGTVTGFTVTYPRGTCRFTLVTTPFIPVSGHSFPGGLNAVSLTGSFTGVQTASGTFTVVPNYPECLGTVTWTARTTAASPPDTTPPDTSIAEGPSGSTATKTPSFTFASSEPNGTFECRIDDGAFAACSSPFKTGSLTDGPHSLEVRATDQAKNTDPTPASRSFSVDTTTPQTTITAGPTGKTTNKTARFAFRSNEAGSTFRCRLDGRRWVACGSPKRYGRLPVGRHTFDVQASDALGNRDPSPARRPFRVAVH